MHFTYLHRRASDNRVMYIGKGSPQRARRWHGRSELWRRTARKHGFKVELVAGWPTEAEAFSHEIFLIETFRAIGEPLVNHTSGGEGASGFSQNSQSNAMRSAALVAAFSRPESLLKLSAAALARWSDPSYREKRMCRIRCIESGVVYESIAAAGRDMNLSAANIHRVCIGKRRQTCGYSFEKVTSEKEN